jgi:HD-like signal output (HDOD) protein
MGRVFDLTTLPVIVREVRQLIEAPDASQTPNG